MSQFDIGSGGPGERISKGGIVAPEVPGGPSLSLAAPGVTAAVPSTKGVAMLGQLLTSLDAAGSAANAYSRDQAQKAAHAEHVANVAARNAREIEALQEGQAAEHLGQTLPAMHDEIVNGKWQPDSGQTFEQFVSQKIDAQTAGLSQAHADYYRKAATPKLLESMYAQQRQAKGAIEENGLGTLAARVAGDPTTIASSLDAARKLAPGKSEPDILASVLLPGMRAAAMTGKDGALDPYKEALGGLFPDKQADIDNTFAAAKARNHAADRQGADDWLAASALEDPFSVQRQKAMSLSESMGMEYVNQKVKAIEAAERESLAGSNATRAALELTQFQTGLDNNNDSLMSDAANTGGASRFEDQTFTDSFGRSHTVTRNDQIESATYRGMARIARDNPDPAVALGRQVEFLSRNGVTFAPWERTMAAGAMVTPSDIAAIAKDGMSAMPANVAVGYDLYKRLGSMSESVRDAHIKSATAGKMYELAALSEQYATPGDPAKSLFMAVKAMAFPGGATAEISTKAVQAEAKSFTEPWLRGNANNGAEIAGKIERLATLYVHANVAGPADAVKAAAEKIKSSHTIINGWAVDTANRLVPPQFGEIGTRLSKQYAEKHPDEGSPGDFALRPGETSSSWVLWNMRTNSQVDNWRTEGFFSNSDLSTYWSGLKEADRAAVIAKTIADSVGHNAAVMRRLLQPALTTVDATGFNPRESLISPPLDTKGLFGAKP